MVVECRRCTFQHGSSEGFVDSWGVNGLNGEYLRPSHYPLAPSSLFNPRFLTRTCCHLQGMSPEEIDEYVRKQGGM